MPIQSDANEYQCPHCKTMFFGKGDAQFVDNVTDETVTICDECGQPFQLVCIGVDLYFETSVKVEPDAT